MILYTVYNCDDQITGISNYIPTNLPSACRVEPINLDIDYPGPNKVYRQSLSFLPSRSRVMILLRLEKKSSGNSQNELPEEICLFDFFKNPVIVLKHIRLS